MINKKTFSRVILALMIAGSLIYAAEPDAETTTPIFGIKFRISSLTEPVYQNITMGHMIIMYLLASVLLLETVFKSIGINGFISKCILIVYIMFIGLLIYTISTNIPWKVF